MEDDSKRNPIEVNLINAGAFITEAQAHASLKSYFNEPGVLPPDDKAHIYGHVYGLNKFRELIGNIDKYNAEHVNDDEKIFGIRAYYGKCERHDPDFPLNPPDAPCRDVFFMPVLKNGSDLFSLNGPKTMIKSIVPGDELILGEARPCPNQCG